MKASNWRFEVYGALAAALILPPVLWLLAAAAGGVLRHGPAAPDVVSLALLARSVLVGSGAALLALLLGVPYGWMVARRRLPGQRFWMPASLLSLLLPPYAATLAWQVLLAREGAVNTWLVHAGWLRAPVSPDECLGAAAIILGLAYWPVAAWLTWFAARSVPRALEEAARLHLPDAAAAAWSAGPALWRAVPAAALLVLLLALADFAVPNTLGVLTYPVQIVKRFESDRDPGATARLALPLLLLVTPLVAWHSALLARTPVGPEDARPVEPVRGRGNTLRALYCAAVVAVSAGIPLGVLAASSLPLSTYGDVWAESVGYFGNTLVSAGGGAALALTAALLYGWCARGRRWGALDTLLTLPYALPGSLVAVALIAILNRPGLLGELYTSVGGLVWAYAVLFFPFAHKGLQPAWGRVDGDLLDESSMLGAGSWARFRSVAWPVLRPYAAAAAGMVMLLAAREVDATALLRIPGGDTVAFRIYDYLHFDPGPKVAALCLLLVVLSAGVAAGLAAAARSGG